MNLSQSGKGNSPAIKTAIVGVALSTAIMILSIAIVMGFKSQIREKVIGFNSSVVLLPTYSSPNIDDNLLELTKPLRTILDSIECVENYHLVSSLPAILKTDTDFKGIYLRGVAADYDFSFIEDNIVTGKLADYNNSKCNNDIYISQIIANELGLKVGDYINSYFIIDDIRVRRLKVAAIFNTHFEDYDSYYVYSNIKLIQDLSGFTSTQGSSIEIKTYDINNINYDTSIIADAITQAAIEGKINSAYRINNAEQMGAGYFGWLALLDTNVVVILILMTLVACFTLISGMMILILEKVKFIGILKVLGASNKQISNIFIQLAMKVGLIGMVVGNFLAGVFVYLQDKYHLIGLDPQSYYIDFVPVEINFYHIIVLNILILLVIWCTLILPAHIVSRISPAETLKFE